MGSVQWMADCMRLRMGIVWVKYSSWAPVAPTHRQFGSARTAQLTRIVWEVVNGHLRF